MAIVVVEILLEICGIYIDRGAKHNLINVKFYIKECVGGGGVSITCKVDETARLVSPNDASIMSLYCAALYTRLGIGNQHTYFLGSVTKVDSCSAPGLLTLGHPVKY